MTRAIVPPGREHVVDVGCIRRRIGRAADRFDREPQVFANRHPRQQRVLLEDDPAIGAGSSDRFAVQ